MDKKGFTLIELMITVAIIAIIASLAVPYLISALWTTNEAAVISALRSINTSNCSYKMQFSSYAAELKDLNPDIIDPALASGNKFDYDFTYSRSSSCTFECYANPTSNAAGTRSFFINERGDIKQTAFEGTPFLNGGEGWNILK